MMIPLPYFYVLATLVVTAVSIGGKVDYHNLPNNTVFPGPWDEYIKAPANKSFITPQRIWKVQGNVTTSSDGSRLEARSHASGRSILIGEGGHITLEFAENIAGQVCFELESSANEPVVMLSFSESSEFVGELPDATNEEEWDLPFAFHVGNRTGSMCVPPEFLRGAFKYLTLYIKNVPVVDDGENTMTRGWSLGSVMRAAQKILGLSSMVEHQSDLGEKRPYSKPSVGIERVWVNCTAFPSQFNGRAYSGYFYSSSNLLNRIWYSGAYTLQLSTIEPKEGSVLIPVNRFTDHNQSPPGSWYSNYTVAHGTAVTTDGAKRDRLVWPGDMYISIPGIAVSTYDMLAVRNALDILYERQYSDGRLPYAGPPLSYRNEFSDPYHMHTLLGTYEYVLYSGDVAWLREKWPAYLRALEVSTSKVDSTDLMHVTSTFDWNRHGMGGHNVEASAILHTVLKRSIELASFLQHGNSSRHSDLEYQHNIKSWHHLRSRLESGIRELYCQDTGLYADNLGDRHCHGSDHVDPQDGNSWALISGINKPSSPSLPLSRNLRSRWNKFGAPAPEFPYVMSPFSSSFELQAHCAASHHDAAVELMLLMWGHLLDGPGFTNSTLAEGFRTDGYVHYPAYPVPSRNSHAHGWSAGPTSVLSNGILGIKIRKPGGVEWTVNPVLTKWLGWAKGGFAVREGSFEVALRRVLLVDASARGQILKKGVHAVVSAPEGSQGSFGWGDEDGADSFRAEMVGGRRRAWVRWEETANAKTEARFVTEELDVGDGEAAGVRGTEEEKWYDENVPYGNDATRVLMFDYSFVAPMMEEREPGVVDFEGMARGYVKPLGWEEDEEQGVGEL